MPRPTPSLHKPPVRRTTRRAAANAIATLAALACATLAGCHGERSDDPPRQFLPDMDDSPKYKPQTGTEFFADGRAMRPWVPGTVAYGFETNPDPALEFLVERSRFLEAGVVYSGITGTDDQGQPVFADTIPVPVTREIVLRGQERFNIYCSACHGLYGDGKGTVGVQWSYPVPNFHDLKYIDPQQATARDGYIFNVILNGVPDPQGGPHKMPPYGHAITEPDAWAIVAYVRALQQVWVTDLVSLPADQRERLQATRPKAPVDPAPGGEAASGGALGPADPGTDAGSGTGSGTGTRQVPAPLPPPPTPPGSPQTGGDQ